MKIILIVSFGVNEGKVYEFNSNEKSIIKIGRKQAEGIDIVFADEACSRLQCT